MVQIKREKVVNKPLRLILVFACVYFFLVSIGLMGTAFKGFGKEFAEALINSTSNPFTGLFIGILATCLVQSSSTTTSIVVGMVASGVLTVSNAIPIIMGANIGTSVTNTLVAIGHITRREEFKRAFAGATVHDFFNLICVSIMFPLELLTGFLSKIANFLAAAFQNSGGVKFTSPIKAITKPTIKGIKHFLKDTLEIHAETAYVIMLILSFILMFGALYFIVKLMKSLVMEQAEASIDKVIGKNGVLGIIIGIVFTILVQSSSITTSLLIPLIGAGIFTLEAVFPITLGANIGTTCTAILASFATGNMAAITIAFVHFTFNVLGVFLIYPIKIFRRAPIIFATALGNLAYHKRRFAFLFIIGIYFVIPFLLIFFTR